jgi:hypothetical protein
MALMPIFVDRVVQYPRRAVITHTDGGNIKSGDVITLTPDPGTITQAGTPVNATNLNAIRTTINLNSAIMSLGGLLG